MTVGFGQGCVSKVLLEYERHATLTSQLYGELGLGPDSGKSSTKPVKLESMVGIDVIE